MRNLTKFIPSLNNSSEVQNAFGQYVYVGLDFGTSNSVVSICYWDEEKQFPDVKSLKFKEGDLSNPECIPTVVFIDQDNGEFMIGTKAKEQLIKGEAETDKNYFSSFKMELGLDQGALYHGSVLLRGKKPISF